MASILHILTPEPKNLDRCLRKIGGQPFIWVYLGQSINDFRRVRSCFEGKGAYFDTTDRFHEASASLRGPYLDYLYQIGSKLDSLHWWLTAIAYRSGYTSKTFHQACYLKVALQLVQKKDTFNALVLVTDDQVAHALKDNLKSGGASELNVRATGRHNLIGAALDVIRILAHRSFFIFREGSRIIESRWKIRRPYVPTEPSTVLLSWLTAGNLSMKGDFHKSYFGDLADRLKEMGCDLAVAPMIIRQVSYRDALDGLKDAPLPMMVPHRYIGLLDLVRAALSSCIKPSLPCPLPKLYDMDISALVAADMRHHWVSNGSADALMTSMVIRNWAARGFPVTRLIYIFENQPYEKAICWQARRSLPSATVVGYQHTRVAPLILQVNLADGGEPDSPLPDWIVTLGKHTAGLLLASGHQRGKLRDGGALQMQNLLARRPEPLNSGAGPAIPSLLVATGRREEAAELVDLALQLFNEDDGVNIVIKYHPAYPLSEVGSLSNDQLPRHISVSARPITELILESSIMLYSSSTVCVEAISLGVPAVHLRTQFDLDIDALGAAPQLRLEATGLDELKEKTWWLINNRAEYVAQHRESWDSFINDMYSPVSEDTYRAFLGPAQDATPDAESSTSGQPATAQD